MVLLSSNHLWCSIAGTSTGCFQSFILLIDVGQAEVDYFDVILIIEEQVFRLEISVAYLYFVNVLDT